MTLWSLRSSRNSHLWENKDENATQILFRVNYVLRAWEAAKKVEQHFHPVHHDHSNTKWQKPMVGMYLKRNVDVTFQLDLDSACIAALVIWYVS